MNTLSPPGIFLSWVGCKLLPKLQHHHWGHMALTAEHALRVAQMQPGQLKLCMQPPAALLQLVNTSTGKIMPYHKVAIKTGLSLDSPSENPAPQPGRWLLSRAMCRHTGGGSESCQAAGHAATGCPRASAGTLETACSNTRRAGNWWCWDSAAEPLVLKPRQIKGVSGTQAPAAPPSPMRCRCARRLWSSERAARNWASLKNWLCSWVLSAFAKTLAQNIWLNPYFFLSPYCPNNLITLVLWEAGGWKQ